MEKKLSILMKLWTVEAILNGLKTQTRRPTKFDIPIGAIVGVDKMTGELDYRMVDRKSVHTLGKCRYGKVGDELYVKETFYAYGKWERTSAKTKKLGNDKWKFIDLTGKMSVKYFYEDAPPNLVQKGISEKVGYYKRPAVFMPFRASRLGIKITDLRAERIHKISYADCEAEGVKPRAECWGLGHMNSALKYDFKKLWDEINKDRGFGFDSKCWVWAITFEKFLLKNGEKI